MNLFTNFGIRAQRGLSQQIQTRTRTGYNYQVCDWNCNCSCGPICYSAYPSCGSGQEQVTCSLGGWPCTSSYSTWYAYCRCDSYYYTSCSWTGYSAWSNVSSCTTTSPSCSQGALQRQCQTILI